MRQSHVKGWKFGQLSWLSAAAFMVTGWISGVVPAIAQSDLPTCQPPRPGEYLVLVVSETQENRQRIRQTLPSGAKTTLCRYLDNVVTRIGGFKSLEDANDWARFVNEIVGLSAYVARPAIAIAPSSTNSITQNLGSGYAVLVDYSNQPQIAAQVRQLLGGDVGLVSYGQRPYLLAVHTTNQSEANAALRRLSDRGFLAMLVDSRKVTVIRPVVNF
jgi:hypothetical protein